jgi:endoglycosylceramidase
VRRVGLIALLCLCVAIGGVSVQPTYASPHTSSVTQSQVRRAGHWLVDGQGRVLVLHGFNVIRKTAPYYPTHFTDRDAHYLVNHGFDAVRIGLIWAGVEPRPGHYDDRYIRKFIAFNNLLARHGIHALIDFHQDAWSKRAGGDGAPGWANLSNNLLSDFQSFWDNDAAPDRVGIQTHFAAAWRHVVHRIDASAGARRIIGFDPFNEPYAGLGSLCAPFVPCPSFESGELAAFYERVITAIRSTGDRHVIFPEGVAQNGIAEPSLPQFEDDQTAFSFHYYCQVTQTATSSSPIDAACGPLEQHGIGSFLDYDARLEVPGVLGEFSGDDADDDNAAMVDLAGLHFLSWMAWMYYTAKEDPANLAGQGFVRDDRRAAGQRNVKAGKLAAFEVPYPQAIAGTPISCAYDRTSRRLVLSYLSQGVPGSHLDSHVRTRIFVPRLVYPHGYRVTAQGARLYSRAGSQYLRLAALPGAKTVRVAIRPA